MSPDLCTLDHMSTQADLSRLEKFFSAYFNQDWDDAENPEGVVRRFKAEATTEERTTLAAAHPLGHLPTGSVPEWITFSPDSKTLYVSNSGAGSVTPIDVEDLKQIATIPVGEVPKRINTLVFH
jgi:YVTN family beta-propeller protein